MKDKDFLDALFEADRSKALKLSFEDVEYNLLQETNLPSKVYSKGRIRGFRKLYLGVLLLLTLVLILFYLVRSEELQENKNNSSKIEELQKQEKYLRLDDSIHQYPGTTDNTAFGLKNTEPQRKVDAIKEDTLLADIIEADELQEATKKENSQSIKAGQVTKAIEQKKIAELPPSNGEKEPYTKTENTLFFKISNQINLSRINYFIAEMARFGIEVESEISLNATRSSIHKLNLELNYPGGIDWNFKALGYEWVEFKLVLDENQKPINMAYRYNSRESFSLPFPIKEQSKEKFKTKLLLGKKR